MSERTDSPFSAAVQYQTVGVAANLPVFYQQLGAKLAFPLSWAGGNYSDFITWRRVAREKVLNLLLQNAAPVPFDAAVIAEQDRGSYFARQVVFNLTTESRVLSLMLVPKGEGPFPAVLLLHDHGAKFDIGKEKVIEPWGDETKLASAREWVNLYNSGRFIGNELVARGYLVLAVDALGWGDRGGSDYGFEVQQALASNLLGLGSSLAGLMACEDRRTAEFLAALPEVASTKVAAVGFSMGGYRAWQVAALSDVIGAAVAVGWLGTLQGLLVPGNNLVRGQSAFYMIHPGLANYLDFPDVASIAAPKPMLFYNGASDHLFPLNSVQEAYAKLQTVWRSRQAGEQLVTKIWPDLGHVFVKEMQDEAFDWLDRWAQQAGGRESYVQGPDG